MNQPTTVGDVLALYGRKGEENYGEDVTQLEHALQCAALAARSGASDALIGAALLHDIGHLVADVQGDLRFDLATDDDVHEAIGARVLSPIFGPAVAQPVALHVTAKRWRCTVEPTYFESLSATSQATFRAQGGKLDAEAQRRFEAHPGREAALLLRSWDDVGKVPDWAVPGLDSYRELLEGLAAQHASA